MIFTANPPKRALPKTLLNIDSLYFSQKDLNGNCNGVCPKKGDIAQVLEVKNGGWLNIKLERTGNIFKIQNGPYIKPFSQATKKVQNKRTIPSFDQESFWAPSNLYQDCTISYYNDSGLEDVFYTKQKLLDVETNKNFESLNFMVSIISWLLIMTAGIVFVIYM